MHHRNPAGKRIDTRSIQLSYRLWSLPAFFLYVGWREQNHPPRTARYLADPPTQLIGTHPPEIVIERRNEPEYLVMQEHLADIVMPTLGGAYCGRKSTCPSMWELLNLYAFNLSQTAGNSN